MTAGMIPIENSKQVAVLVTSSISILMVVVAVGLRIVAKKMGNRIDYSDYCILAAGLWNTAMHTCCISLVTHGGFGFHTIEVFRRFGPETATFFFKGIMSFSILWNATVCFSKLSILAMYAALIPLLSMWRWARILGFLIVIWNIANILAALLICRPLARNWDFTIPGTCGSQPSFYFSMGIINLITDAVMVALPMPYLYKLRISWRRKLAVMALLSIGVGTWAITIYRQTLLPNLDFMDMTYEGVLATLLSGLEPAVAIVLACIPLMRPLFGRTRNAAHSGYSYGSSTHTSIFTKKGSRAQNLDPTATFSELTDDNDTSSQIQLQPIKNSRLVRVPSVYDHQSKASASLNQAIAVEKEWEVRRD